ncbi:MAG: hypothetical protein J3K34DRAFT_522545 [Monoraphidium minutum]|nr:MAG: hypothetical protein J3K34DRAFT_522545 [Monoraphidium minutum]
MADPAVPSPSGPLKLCQTASNAVAPLTEGAPLGPWLTDFETTMIICGVAQANWPRTLFLAISKGPESGSNWRRAVLKAIMVELKRLGDPMTQSWEVTTEALLSAAAPLDAPYRRLYELLDWAPRPPSESIEASLRRLRDLVAALPDDVTVPPALLALKRFGGWAAPIQFRTTAAGAQPWTGSADDTATFFQQAAALDNAQPYWAWVAGRNSGGASGSRNCGGASGSRDGSGGGGSKGGKRPAGNGGGENKKPRSELHPTAADRAKIKPALDDAAKTAYKEAGRCWWCGSTDADAHDKGQDCPHREMAKAIMREGGVFPRPRADKGKRPARSAKGGKRG